MAHISQQDYLRNQQYRSAENLNARIRLHQLYNTNPQDFHRWLFNLMLTRGGTRAHVLEVGCGSGELWHRNVDRIPDSWQVTLSDFSPGMVTEARERLSMDGFQPDSQVIDVHAIPYPEATFDMLIANAMLYHVPDLPRAIGELRRVLKPDGTLHAVTMGRDHMREINMLVHAVAPELGMDQKNFERPFSLENGEQQLAQFFGTVERHDFDCDLKVTATEPLVDYIASMRGSREHLGERLETLRHNIQEGIVQDGFIHITKDTGVFIAHDYRSGGET